MTFQDGDVAIRVTADARALDRGMDMADRRVARSRQRIGRDLRGLDSNFKRSFSSAAANVERNSAKMQRSITKTRSSIRGLGTVIAALGAARLARSFGGFETALQQTVGLVGVAQEEVDGFKESILEIGPAVGKGPRELAEAMFFITSAGQRGQQAIDTLTDSARAASAGLGETKDVADAVTSAMNAYAAENLTAARATDVLVATVKEGKLEASELASSIGRILPFAQAAGVSLDEIGATIAAVTRIGGQTTEVISGLRGVMIALTKENEKGVVALDKVNLTFADLRRNIREKGLIVALQDLRGVIGDSETALTDIFGRAEAAAVVLALTGDNAELVAEIFERLKNSTGSLDKAFAAISDTAAFRFNSAMSRMAASTLTIAADIMPAFASALEFAAANMRALTVAIGGFIAFKIVGILVAAAAAMAGFAASIGVATVAMLGLQAALLGPIGIAIGVVAALVAGVLILISTTDSAKDSEDRFKDSLAALNDELKTAEERTKDLTKARRDSVLEQGRLDLAEEEARLAKFERIRDAFEKRRVNMEGRVDNFRQEIATRALANNAKLEESEQRILELREAIAKVEAGPTVAAVPPIVPFTGVKEGSGGATEASDALKSSFESLRNSLDPLGAATRAYNKDLDTLIAAEKAGLLTENELLDSINALRDARNEARFPLVAIQKALAEERLQASMTNKEREIHVRLLAFENDLRDKGLILTDATRASLEQELIAIRDITEAREASEKAVEDLANAQKRAAEKVAAAQKQQAEDFETAFKDSFTSIIKGTESVGDAFEKMGQRILDMLVEIALNDLFNGTNNLGSGGGLGGLVDMLGGLVGLFSGGSAFGAPGLGAGQPFHKGGIVGRDGGKPRPVPIPANSNIPRFHEGGMAGLRPREKLIVAEDGEEILTEENPRHARNAGRGQRGGIVVNNHFPNAVNERGIRTAASESSAKTGAAVQRGMMRKGIG